VATQRSSLQRRAEVFAALGDPRRLEIAEELSRSDRTPGELIEKFELSSALLAHHLDVLEHAGLIERTNSHADGRKRFVRLLTQHRTLLTAHAVPREVTFVCTHNSARSQLAAALWRRLTGRKADSAGTQPADRVHPSAIEVAERHGLDLRNTRPRQLGTITPATTIITVCDQAHDELPASLRRLHWSLADPAEVGTVRAFNDAFTTLHERIEMFSLPAHPRKE
jgi:ArsR family transcriptional regulator, arsenate/arsenite/antimonite-responsive transcriptional repressor / arsenate reductase (thioredoxin)